MKDITTRVKIGIMTLVSLVLFVVMIVLISKLSLKPQRELRVHFRFINSLEIGAPVRFAGARIGEIKRVQILTQDERAQFPKNPPYVQVYASIDQKVLIPKGTKAMVNTMGFMGEKYLELMPEPNSTAYIGNDEMLESIDPTAMDTVFGAAKKLADEMQISAKNLNTLTTEMQDRLPVLIGELEKTLVSAQELAGDAKHLTGDVQRMVNNNEDTLPHLIANARQMTIYMKSLSHILARRPWKLIWGFSGPHPIESEEEKYVSPVSKSALDDQPLKE